MSVLTKTALIYGGGYFVLTLLAACAATLGEPIGPAFADIAKGMLIIVVSAGIVAFISEGFHRILIRSRQTNFSMKVPVFQIFAQLILTGLLLSQARQFDTMGISYLLLALVMIYTVFISKKTVLSKEFWMINVCCTIVIASSQPISLIISDIYFGASPKEKEDQFLIIIKVVLSCLILGIPSYMNYRRLKKAE
jgi:hypothetical protein